MEYDWTQERAKAELAFAGEKPHAETEQEIIETFRRSPALVIEEIESVGREVQRGAVRSGWAVLRARLKAVERASVIVSDAPSRDKRVAQAEAWIRVAGLHLDRWSEVEDELFGERGKLRSWGAEESLRARMRTAWEAARPVGEQVEREQREVKVA